MMFAASSALSASSIPLVSPGLVPAQSSGAPSAAHDGAPEAGEACVGVLAYCARTAALAALREADPVIKAAAARTLYTDVLEGRATCSAHLELTEPEGLPGRPARPELVDPRQLKRRSMQSPQGRAVLLHALAHIEFNAINLALDAVWRFSGMPAAFYVDWLKVAAEEAYHFSLLSARLAEYGHVYGDFPAHDGLWDMCERTRGDVLARMALVPRTLEARGLDASPPIRARLQQAGDQASAAILDVILRDEIGHVLIGNRWFRHLCEGGALDPHETYARLADQYHAPKLRGPFNFEARREAGFDEAELAALTALAGLDASSGSSAEAVVLTERLEAEG
ncbi:ferritin-like domain-containing protein [Paraburkholderia bryophila]|uniref:ferritin-like domain-containing protein n=1 Tax=Burkholderiaceae TaxID=119060 RepID=UPI000A7924C0|nr:ferritin-like domain-containing protein [Burkholderia sp. 9120]